MRWALLLTCSGLTALTFACNDDQGSAAAAEEELTQAAKPAASDEGDDPAITALMNSVWDKNGPFEYLPWDYAPDGCFDRSFYMAMELASRGIPVREEVINMRWLASSEGRPQFVPVDPVSGKLVEYRGKQVKWDYHIAAVLLPGEKVKIKQPMILDRALEPRPVSVETWVHDANSGSIPQSTDENAAAGVKGFNQFSTKGAPYVGVGPFLNGNWSTFRSEPERMPTFKADSIKISCNHLVKIWTDCLESEDRTEKAATVTKRTNELLRTLADKQLLEEWDGQAIECTTDTQFQCMSVE